MEKKRKKHHRDANSKLKSEKICRVSVLQEKRKRGNRRRTYKLRDISVQFSRSVVFDSLCPHEPQHTRPPCLSPTPGVYPNSYPLSRGCHPTISSSVVPFSCPQSFSASGTFQMSQLFASGGQSICSFNFNISLSNEYPGLISFRMDWLDLLAVQGTLKCLLQHHSSKASILWCSAFFNSRRSFSCII